MIVAISKGLEQMGRELVKRGYDVVKYGEYNYPIDAILYESFMPDLSFVSNNNIPSLTSTAGRNDYGVFMLNTEGRNLDEIISMLNSRLYSPLI